MGKLSPFARESIRTGAEDRLAVSPMALLELTYLHEIGRVRAHGDEICADLQEHLNLEVDGAPFRDVVAAAKELTWTRDSFDRLIAAQAICSGAELLTADERMREHLPSARW